MKYKRLLQTALWHLLLIFLSLPYVFPLLWMVLGSFKTNEEIFLNPLALPQSWSFQAYRDGWNSVGPVSYTHLDVYKRQRGSVPGGRSDGSHA